jgi:hypothetical protein
MWILAIVLLSGALFSLGDIAAQRWSKDLTSLTWFLIMLVVGTAAYAVFGFLMRYAEFSKVSIWTSITLTSLSCLYGLLVLRDSWTVYKIAAFFFAMIAAYLSVL